MKTEQIVDITKLHLKRLNDATDEEAWQYEDMEFFRLSTLTPSSLVHDVVLPIWRDINEHVIVVGSFGGSDKEPDWDQTYGEKQDCFIREKNSFVFKQSFCLE